MKTVSFIIIIVGVIMIAYNRFSFISNDKIADIGQVQMMKHKNQNIQWPPIAGLALVVGGILMITIPKKDI
jgi:multidrug transporter EmrE-like cation transporter